jgi:hypothetical protein
MEDSTAPRILSAPTNVARMEFVCMGSVSVTLDIVARIVQAPCNAPSPNALMVLLASAAVVVIAYSVAVSATQDSRVMTVQPPSRAQ